MGAKQPMPGANKSRATQLMACIPARMASSRLPGKPLLDLDNIPMVIRVADNLAAVLPRETILICSADTAILQAAKSYGYQAFQTHDRHASGTDRIAQAAAHYPAQLYLNVQGDMPVLDGRDISNLLQLAQQHPWDMVTMAKPLRAGSAYNDPNTVKVVCDQQGKALYFSRSPIPHQRAQTAIPKGIMAHVGVYCFTASALQRFVTAPRGVLEQAEDLEQLRALELGMTIGVYQANHPCLSVDTPQDVLSVKDWLRQAAGQVPAQQTLAAAPSA